MIVGSFRHFIKNYCLLPYLYMVLLYGPYQRALPPDCEFSD